MQRQVERFCSSGTEADIRWGGLTDWWVAGSYDDLLITNPTTFDRLAEYLRKNGANLPVPGSTLKAYGTVDVK
ncbi:hypothetical protein CEJ98_14905 [Burkholderia gladioli pv. gladioli]|nr:hypothetical protein CEJ98_14905 [Burkholderia gladioli pv. gladioli]AWY54617.1 hypothetical protein A8H28_26220 [Burkholderia gladioli pv. gladioli]